MLPSSHHITSHHITSHHITSPALLIFLVVVIVRSFYGTARGTCARRCCPWSSVSYPSPWPSQVYNNNYYSSCIDNKAPSPYNNNYLLPLTHRLVPFAMAFAGRQ